MSLSSNQLDWLKQFDEYTVDNPSVIFGNGLMDQVAMVKTFINVKGRFPSLDNSSDHAFIAAVEDLLVIYQTELAAAIGEFPDE